MDPFYTLLATTDDAHRAALTDHLRRCPEAVVVDAADSALGLRRALRVRPSDILLLDARLPPDGGDATLARLADDAPVAVIVTAARPGDGLWAYAHGAVDCLPAPLDPRRLAEAAHRAAERVIQARIRAHRTDLLDLLGGDDVHAPPPASVQDGGPLVVRSGSQLIFLDPDEIDWIEAAGVYVEIHAGGARHLVRESLRHVEERLDPLRFVRIHRSTVLNVDRVRKIVPHLNGGAVVLLKDGSQLKMSRSYRERVHPALG